MDIIFFIGERAHLAELFGKDSPICPTLVRYADEDHKSPSCCDWHIPGTPWWAE